MKILLIGKGTLLGATLMRASTGHEVIAPDQSELDIRSLGMIDAAITGHRPDIVINTVSMNEVPLCEAEPASAFAMNCVAIRDLAAACGRTGAVFVMFSTDYVFDGEKNASYLEDDKPAPLQIYGISRTAGEFAALSAAPDLTIIIRTCGLYGMPETPTREENFVEQRISDAEAKRPIAMGSDQIVSPTFIDDLSRAVFLLMEHPRRAPGIYHLVNEGKCSWYEFTKAIYEIMSIGVQVKPVDRSGQNTVLRRPRYSALANTKARELGIVLPSWRSGLERYLRQRYASGRSG